MGRQMFAKGGAAFPDLSGDGNVTQKDILMGRGVIPMQDGGMAPMPMAAAPGPQMMPPGLPPIDPNSVDINQAAQAAMQQGMDPAVMEGMLTQYSAGLEDLENAEDYETVMNGIRGDDQPIESRYQELASVVGSEDAQQTPESVLALVQPVMMMAAVDQGIGGLAAEQMNAPVEGAVAEGIMSTVNMGGPDQAQGGPAPVNFNQGGPVAYMADGGDSRLGQIYQDRQAVYGNILGMADQEAELADQTDMTKAQMLFDVAQGALMFATPGERNMSPAERLAQAFTPVLGNISTRAGELQKFKNAQNQEKRALNLQALGAAENQLAFELKVDADKAAQAAEQSWKSNESALERAHDILKLDKQFKFTRQENESAQSFQMRLADRKGEIQRTLQTLQGAQAVDQINLRGRLQTELAELNNTFNRAMQQDRFDFTKSERLDTQGYQDEVRQQQFANQKAIIALEFDNTKEGMALRSQLEQENMRLGSELRIGENQLAFENTLKRDGILHINDISKMDRGHEQNVALVSHRGAIQRENQELQNAFTAAESALDRAQKENLQLNDQTFRRLMQEEMQTFTSDQNEIDRAIAKTNRAFDEALAVRGADQKDVSLGLAERAQALDEAYKLGMLSIERLVANATKVGSKAKTDELTYLTNPERMTQYANGTLGDETALYEQALLDYTSAKDVWDPALGKYVEGSAGKLSPRVLESVQQGNPKLFTQITGTQLADDGSNLPEAPLTLLGANSQNSDIMNADGTVNLQSSVFEVTRPNRYNPDVDYKQVIGMSRLYPGLKKIVSEGYAEATDGMPTEEAQMHSEAQKTLNAFSNDLLQFSTQISGDRVLKFVQELIEQETQNLRPGGILLKTDSDARSSLKALRDGLIQGMQLKAAQLPEYGGNSSGLGESRIQASRAAMDEMKVLLNEVLAFEEGFGYTPTVRTTETDNDQSTGTARNQILDMRKQNNGGQ